MNEQHHNKINLPSKDKVNLYLRSWKVFLWLLTLSVIGTGSAYIIDRNRAAANGVDLDPKPALTGGVPTEVPDFIVGAPFVPTATPIPPTETPVPTWTPTPQPTEVSIIEATAVPENQSSKDDEVILSETQKLVEKVALAKLKITNSQISEERANYDAEVKKIKDSIENGDLSVITEKSEDGKSIKVYFRDEKGKFVWVESGPPQNPPVKAYDIPFESVWRWNFGENRLTAVDANGISYGEVESGTRTAGNFEWNWDRFQDDDIDSSEKISIFSVQGWNYYVEPGVKLSEEDYKNQIIEFLMKMNGLSSNDLKKLGLYIDPSWPDLNQKYLARAFAGVQNVDIAKIGGGRGGLGQIKVGENSDWGKGDLFFVTLKETFTNQSKGDVCDPKQNHFIEAWTTTFGGAGYIKIGGSKSDEMRGFIKDVVGGLNLVPIDC